MYCEPALLARDNGFGSVTRCCHGLVHVQVGVTTLTLSETQYQRFVALLTDSAANFEMHLHASRDTEPEVLEHPVREIRDAD